MPFRFGKGAGGVVEGLLIHLSLIWAKYISLARPNTQSWSENSKNSP